MPPEQILIEGITSWIHNHNITAGLIFALIIVNLDLGDIIILFLIILGIQYGW